MNESARQPARRLPGCEEPQARTNGVLWSLEDPSRRARLDGGAMESARANRALRAYLALGPGRTLPGLAAYYVSRPLDERAPGWKQLQKWAQRYAWQARANHYDEIGADRQRMAVLARRREVLEQGVAVMVERVAALKEIYTQLAGDLQKEDRRWLSETRSLRGENGEMGQVQVHRFNAPLVAQVRGVLDDLARETGGRTQTSAAANVSENDQTRQVDFSGLDETELDTMETLLIKAGGHGA